MKGCCGCGGAKKDAPAKKAAAKKEAPKKKAAAAK